MANCYSACHEYSFFSLSERNFRPTFFAKVALAEDTSANRFYGITGPVLMSRATSKIIIAI